MYEVKQLKNGKEMILRFLPFFLMTVKAVYYWPGTEPMPGPEIWRDRDQNQGRDQKYDGTGTSFDPGPGPGPGPEPGRVRAQDHDREPDKD